MIESNLKKYSELESLQKTTNDLLNSTTVKLNLSEEQIAAINELKDHTKEELYPFFDIARKENLTGQDLESTIGKCFAKYQKYLSKLDFFYLDKFDQKLYRLIKRQKSLLCLIIQMLKKTIIGNL